MTLEILSPEKTLFRGEAERVILQQRAMDEVLDAAYLDGQTAARMEKLGSPDQARTNISSLYRFAMN